MQRPFILIVSLVFASVSTEAHSILTHGAETAPLDTTEAVSIGGIEQFISIQAQDKTHPVLLYLHGGPGESVMQQAESFTKKLQEHFVVVQWDQRETGKTKKLNPSPKPITVERMQEDTYSMVKYLLEKFGREKLYLVGHSWGTYLGFHLADQHPQLLYAYVAISPLVDQVESERMVMNMLKEHAKQTSNERAAKELATVKVPFESLDDMLISRKWLYTYLNQPVPDSVMVQVRAYLTLWADTWLAVFNKASRHNLFNTLPKVDCPVYFFVGRNDYQTNATIAERYYHQLRASRKELFWFENSAHDIPSTEPEKMQDILIKKILPDTI